MKSEEQELRWIQESPPYWDAAKARIIGAAPPGTFAPDRLSRLRDGDLLPGDWFRVEAGDRVVGFGWMDTTWGDAEILLAVDPERRNVGVGSFILDHLTKAPGVANIRSSFSLKQVKFKTALPLDQLWPEAVNGQGRTPERRPSRRGRM